MSRPAARAAGPCPCGGHPAGTAYADCCGRYHAGTPAPDAEALMRSRYTAYVLGDAAYLLATWDPATRPPALDLGAGHGQATHWLGLSVGRVEAGPGTARVAFVARFKSGGRAGRLAENSRFTRADDGRWYYVDGEIA